MQARHGDLFLKPATIPEDAKPQSGRVVLAEGEATGHTHRLANQSMGILFLLGTQLYLRAIKESQIIHEEHGTVTLPPGDYMVKVQRELDPLGHIRPVVD